MLMFINKVFTISYFTLCFNFYYFISNIQISKRRTYVVQRKTSKCLKIFITIAVIVVAIPVLLLFTDFWFSSSVVEIKSYFKDYEHPINKEFTNLKQNKIKSQIFKINLLSGSFDQVNRCFLNTKAQNSTKDIVKFKSPHLHVIQDGKDFPLTCLDKKIIDSSDFVFKGLYYLSMVVFIIIVIVCAILITCTWIKCEKHNYIDYNIRGNVEDSISDSRVNQHLISA